MRDGWRKLQPPTAAPLVDSLPALTRSLESPTGLVTGVLHYGSEGARRTNARDSLAPGYNRRRSLDVRDQGELPLLEPFGVCLVNFTLARSGRR